MTKAIKRKEESEKGTLEILFPKLVPLLKKPSLTVLGLVFPLCSITIGGFLLSLGSNLGLPEVIEIGSLTLSPLMAKVLASIFLGWASTLLLIAFCAPKSRNETLTIEDKLQAGPVRLRNETLSEIEEEIIKIEEKLPASPFRLLLLNRLLNSTLKSIMAIRNQAKLEGIQKDLDNYIDKVDTLLQEANRDTIILALCGEKGVSRSQILDYFRKFFTFAIKNQRHLKRIGGIRVCRIFVPSLSGLKDTTREIIKLHYDHEEYGIMALEVPVESHPALKEYIEIIKRLDEGAGFVLFYNPNKAVAITHKGMDKDLTFMEFSDTLIIQEFLRMFKKLSIQSNEFKNNDEKNIQLKSLFNRLRIPND